MMCSHIAEDQPLLADHKAQVQLDLYALTSSVQLVHIRIDFDHSSIADHTYLSARQVGIFVGYLSEDQRTGILGPG